MKVNRKSICATKPWSECNDMDAHTVWWVKRSEICIKKYRKEFSNFIRFFKTNSPTGICLFKDNDGKSRTICKICLQLTIKRPKDAFDAVLVSLLLALNSLTDFVVHCWIWTKRMSAGKANIFEYLKSFHFHKICWPKKSRKFQET